jgi:hypothetical protein
MAECLNYFNVYSDGGFHLFNFLSHITPCNLNKDTKRVKVNLSLSLYLFQACILQNLKSFSKLKNSIPLFIKREGKKAKNVFHTMKSDLLASFCSCLKFVSL